jgi:hypothetical protein
MRIEHSDFGKITVDGKLYPHDVVISLYDEIRKRKKKLSKKKYGTPHIISKAEAKSVFEKGCDPLIVGAGREGQVRLSPRVSEYRAKKGCAVVLQPTQEAIRRFNQSTANEIGLIHVTC